MALLVGDERIHWQEFRTYGEAYAAWQQRQAQLQHLQQAYQKAVRQRMQHCNGSKGIMCGRCKTVYEPGNGSGVMFVAVLTIGTAAPRTTPVTIPGVPDDADQGSRLNLPRPSCLRELPAINSVASLLVTQD